MNPPFGELRAAQASRGPKPGIGNSESAEAAPSIAARLNRLPITRTHRFVILIAGIGTFFDLFDIFLAGVLGTVLTTRFQLDRVSLPAVIGSSFLGMFVGALTLGWYADRVGRRRAFLVNLGIYSVFTLAGGLSTGPAMLIASRFLAGIGIGAEPPLVDAYLSEMLPSCERGRCTAAAYTIGFLGVPAVGLLARLLVPIQAFGLDGWRWLFVIGSAGGAIVWTLRRQLPESPRWLESAGRLAEAEAITARWEEEALARGPLPPRLDEQPPRGRATARALFARDHARRTAVLWIFQILQPVGYYGFGTLVPLVLAAKGFPVITSLTYTSIVFLGYPIGSALSVPIVERIDRRWLIVWSATLMTIFGVSLGLASTPPLIVVFGFAYTIASNVFSNAFHIFQAEIFPTFIRATAAGTAYGLSRLSSAAMPLVLLPVLDRWGAAWMFAAVALAMALVVVDIGLFAPSTTGRALEDVR